VNIAGRVRVVAAIAATLALVPAAPASAHTLTGVAPSNYRGRVTGLSPNLVGVRVRLFDLGRRIQFENPTGTTLTIIGYDSEPYIRVGPRGVEENFRAPTHFLNQVAGTTTTLPGNVFPSAPPEWHLIRHAPVARWRDFRTRWEGKEPEIVRADRSHRHVVGTWRILVERDIETEPSASVNGTITWYPPPHAFPYFVYSAWLALGVVAASRLRRWGMVLAAAALGLAVADATHTIGQVAFEPGGSLIFAARLLFGAVFSVAAWITLIASARPLSQGSEGGAFAAGIAAFFVAVLTGAGDANAIVRSQVPSTLPAPLVRLLVASCLGIGVGLAACAAILLRRTAWWSRATAGPDTGPDTGTATV